MKLAGFIGMKLSEITDIKIYGDMSYRGKCPKEDAELTTFVNQLRKHKPELHKLGVHPKNEGVRTNTQAALEKMKGALNKGAADYIIPASPAFVCEFKRQDPTARELEQEQYEYLTLAASMGSFVCIALTWKDAMNAVNDWELLLTTIK